MNRLIPVLAIPLLFALACGSPEQEPAAVQQASTPTEQIRDQTHLFRKDGLVEAKVVDSNLGGKDFMPGGNLAVYEKDGKSYQVFFTLRRNADRALLLSMNYRDVLDDQEFVPAYGGFFGMDGDTPTLVFQKQKYVVAVTGLTLEDADQAARMIAGYLN